MSDLKPCPFCGCDKIAVSSALNYGRTIYQFHCWKCGAVSGCSETKEGAVRRWNRRNTEDALQAEIGRLKGEVADRDIEGYAGFMIGVDQMKKTVAEKDKEIERLKAALKQIAEIANCRGHLTVATWQKEAWYELAKIAKEALAGVHDTNVGTMEENK